MIIEPLGLSKGNIENVKAENEDLIMQVEDLEIAEADLIQEAEKLQAHEEEASTKYNEDNRDWQNLLGRFKPSRRLRLLWDTANYA